MIRETQIVSQSEWLASLQPGDCVTGPGLRRLQSALPAGCRLSSTNRSGSRWPRRWGSLAGASYQAGRRDDLWKLLPQYYRQSAAEEKAATKRASRPAVGSHSEQNYNTRAVEVFSPGFAHR